MFYDEVKEKRKTKRMRLQVDNEFRQGKIHDLNDQNNVEIFTTLIREVKCLWQSKKLESLKQG